jgi:hypothetical protein
VLHAAILQALAEQDLLSAGAGEPPTSMMARVQGAEQMLLGGQDLLRFGEKHAAPESGQWWLRAPGRQNLSLADRVEMETVRFLQHQPGATWLQIDQAVCQAIPGLLTPPPDLTMAVLESYGEIPGGESDQWRLRPADAAPARRSDLAAVRKMLARLGQQMGFQVSGERPVLWSAGGELPEYAFYQTASTVISQVVFENPYPAARSVLVIPGSRANLLSYRLKRDPRLRDALASGWRVVKFRHLRRMAGIAGITRATFEAQLGADPLEYKAIQMEMF